MSDMENQQASAYRLNKGSGSTHALLMRLIPPRSRVLDVGCASGYLGHLMAEKGCSVVGIEGQPSYVRAARGTGAYVHICEMDLDAGLVPVKEEPFDVILCADVLEHLKDPTVTLGQLRPFLGNNGSLIVSLPNVAHFSVRFQLLIGRFAYATSGILDQTHLHLYTFKSAKQLIADAGFVIEESLAGSDRFGSVLSFGPPIARSLRGLLAYNIVVVARRTDGSSRS